MSARWQGKLLAPSSETFTLYVRADDAARLYVDHELVIDAWEGEDLLYQPGLLTFVSTKRFPRKKFFHRQHVMHASGEYGTRCYGWLLGTFSFFMLQA